MLGNSQVRFGGGRMEKYQEWKLASRLPYNVIAPQVPMMIDREAIKVSRLEATPKSVIQ
jgi:hypothetical protein